jgi:GNAT superfamily N-acetyltransferase
VGDAERAVPRDIAGLNRLFSDAFTDRYRRDGMQGVRVPYLNPAVWEYAIANAGAGAFVWRDARGDLAAFNLAHACRGEGWMGPLAVRVDHQGSGLGRRIVETGIAWLRDAGVRTIGLETMPRTIDNIGFYSRLGFRPGQLTVTLQGPAARGTVPGTGRVGEGTAADRAERLAACAALTERVNPGASYDRECALTLDLGLGDIEFARDRGGELIGFALWHDAALAEGRRSEELRVLKLVATDLAVARRLLDAVGNEAQRRRRPHVTVRCQGAQQALYAALVELGWRVQWTDLRMTLDGFPEPEPHGILLSNWEI